MIKRSNIRFSVILILIFLFSSSVFAEIYCYKDRNGVLRFSNEKTDDRWKSFSKSSDRKNMSKAITLSRPVIFEIQKSLTRLGYNPGKIDGIWGKRTERAVENFQRDEGLEVTGRLDDKTKRHLDDKVTAHREREIQLKHAYEKTRRSLIESEKSMPESPSRGTTGLNTMDDDLEKAYIDQLKNYNSQIKRYEKLGQSKADESVRHFVTSLKYLKLGSMRGLEKYQHEFDKSHESEIEIEKKINDLKNKRQELKIIVIREYGELPEWWSE